MLRRGLWIVLALTMVLAACGDSGSDDGDEPQATQPQATQPQATQPDDDDNGSNQTIETLPDIAGIPDECEALLSISLAIGQVFTGGGANADEIMQAAARDVPGELRDDAAIVIEAFSEYLQGLEELGIDLSDPASMTQLTPDQAQQAAELSESLDTDAVNAAFDNIDAWGEENCSGIGE